MRSLYLLSLEWAAREKEPCETTARRLGLRRVPSYCSANSPGFSSYSVGFYASLGLYSQYCSFKRNCGVPGIHKKKNLLISNGRTHVRQWAASSDDRGHYRQFPQARI